MSIHSLCLIFCRCTFLQWLLPSSLFEYYATSLTNLSLYGFAYSGRMGSVAAQPFSDLSRDNQIQVWALAGPLQDVHKGHSFESVAACLGSLSCWKLNWGHCSALEQVCLPLQHPHSMMLPLQVAFGKLQAGCRVSSTEEWLLPAAQAWLVDCCRDGCPSWGFSLHKEALERWE